MKKLIALIFAALSILIMNVPFAGTAEAARVAVVPIQVNDQLVDRAADFNGYYWDIMIEKFKYPEYELMDDEKVAAVVPDEGLTSYDQATMMSLCEKVDAEVVVAMRLDEIKERPLNFRREPTLEVFMKGEFASYNSASLFCEILKNLSEKRDSLISLHQQEKRNCFHSPACF